MKLTVSFIIPTLNSAAVLETCLKSIKDQDSFNGNEIIIADGGSTDGTLSLAVKYDCRIIKNPLKTAEAGKAVGLAKSKSDLVAFIDSDNILPDKNWLTKMLFPFSDPQIIGSEPIEFTYRLQAGYIERYSALIGANDPYAFFLGNYDRINHINGSWTGLDLETQDHKDYLKIKFTKNSTLPTIGANGTIFRRNFLKHFFKGSYLFDIDILSMAPKPLYFAKVKTGIIHTYCENSFLKFIRKQTRRIRDQFHYQEQRKYQWNTKLQGSSLRKFLTLIKDNFSFGLYSLSFFLPTFDAIRGYIKVRDPAWFFHPLACFSTFIIYSYNSLLILSGIRLVQNRNSWHQ